MRSKEEGFNEGVVVVVDYESDGCGLQILLHTFCASSHQYLISSMAVAYVPGEYHHAKRHVIVKHYA